MRGVVLGLAAFLTFAATALIPLAGQQAPAGIQGTFGTIQGTVMREGTTEPIPDVQISVNGPDTTFATMMVGLSPLDHQAMAQSIVDATAGGTTVPGDLLQAAQAAIRDNAPNGKAPAAPLTAVTDSDGRFTIKDVPVGKATLRAQLKGYFAPAVNGTSQRTLTANAEVTHRETTSVQLRMIPGGTISGRIFDSAGKPLSDTPVQILRPDYVKGVLSPQFFDTKMTDDRGEYRSSRLPPGSYYVVASPLRPRDKSPNPREIPVPTLYPNGLDVAAAQTITLRGGDEIPGINIQVRKATGVKLSGRVVSLLPSGPVLTPRGQPRPAAANVTLMQRDTVGLPEINGGGMVILNANGGVAAKLDDGSFEIPDVPPGAYDLFARLPVAANTGWGTANPPARATTPWAFGRISLDVQGANVENLSIVVRPGLDLKGRVIVDGRPSAGDLQIALEPDDTAANINDGPSSSIYSQIATYNPPIDADGSFVFPLLPEGQYRFQVSFGPRGARPAAPAATPLPPTAYVADIRQGGRSVYDNGFVVDNSPLNAIDIILNTNGGSVEGTVMGLDGKPAFGMIVVLVPPRDRRQNPALYKTVSSDASGHFAISRIPPGEYMLFASENIQSGALRNAEFLTKYSGRGASVTVSDGIQTNAVLGVISSD